MAATCQAPRSLHCGRPCASCCRTPSSSKARSAPICSAGPQRQQLRHPRRRRSWRRPRSGTRSPRPASEPAWRACRTAWTRAWRRRGRTSATASASCSAWRARWRTRPPSPRRRRSARGSSSATSRPPPATSPPTSTSTGRCSGPCRPTGPWSWSATGCTGYASSTRSSCWRAGPWPSEGRLPACSPTRARSAQSSRACVASRAWPDSRPWTLDCPRHCL
mmetsp:Transcript_50874/g.147703  ORF Transcript_50874/g.147703 Transcript_50874/m.147703 type:complete len:220 (-) Transcript_50874:62-721(-)